MALMRSRFILKKSNILAFSWMPKSMRSWLLQLFISFSFRNLFCPWGYFTGNFIGWLKLFNTDYHRYICSANSVIHNQAVEPIRFDVKFWFWDFLNILHMVTNVLTEFTSYESLLVWMPNLTTQMVRGVHAVLSVSSSEIREELVQNTQRFLNDTKRSQYDLLELVAAGLLVGDESSSPQERASLGAAIAIESVRRKVSMLFTYHCRVC